MIAKSIIIQAMILEDVSNTSLHRQMNRYVRISEAYVDDIIRIGVTGYLKRYEKFVAWILGLKKFIPEGWKPEVLSVEITPRQTVMGWTYDRVNQDHVKGEAHKNYKTRKKAQFTFDQTDKVDSIFEKMGGRAKMCKQLGLKPRQLSNWRTYISVETGGRGTIPYKFHSKILEISEKENLGLTNEDFKTFTVKTKARRKNGKFCK